MQQGDIFGWALQRLKYTFTIPVIVYDFNLICFVFTPAFLYSGV